MQVRQLSASLEDYLEAIYSLSAHGGNVHSKDIAESLGVSRASVTGALKLLAQRGLVHYRPYAAVRLTPAGQKAAGQVARKHRILKSFFENVLGIDAGVSQAAACKAEHALGPEVIDRLLYFVDFVNREGKNGRDLAKKFKGYYRKKSNS